MRFPAPGPVGCPAAALAVLCCCAPALAQATQELRGSVRDQTGASIPGATVVLTRPDGTAAGQAVADGAGVFRFPAAPAGPLVLTVPAYSGFAPLTLPLAANARRTGVRLVLAPEAAAETVSVAGDEPISTEASANTDAVAVSGEQLRKLPVFDQDILATLTPFLDAASTSTEGVTLIVDGVEMKDPGVSPSAIQEVRINNDPYAAEFTRPGRGRIEITTKPGSPQFHGEFNVIARNSVFNAKNYFAQVKPPESREIYEGHLSGPVGRGGHTSFIGSTSIRLRNPAVIVNAVTPTGPVRDNVQTPISNSLASFRVTHDFSPAHRLSLGYTFEGETDRNAGVGGIVLAEAGYNFTSREDDLILNDRLILTPNLINQLQVTIEKDEETTTSVTRAQQVQVSGSFTGGGAQADRERSENTIHMNEVVSWSHGRHYLRVGAQLPQVSRRGIDDRTLRLGVYRFASLDTYNAATPYAFQIQQGPGRTVYWINEVGGFVQDQIKLTPRLQASLGLRYDWQTFLPDHNNLAPRASLAFAHDKKTVFRAGSGFFYDRTGGDFPSTVTLLDGVNLRSILLLNPTYPIAPGATLPNQPTNIARFAPGIRTPYAIQYSAGVERQVGGATVSIGYRGQVQIKSFRSRDVNAPILPPNPSLTATYARPDPSFGRIQQIESTARNMLNALDLGFRGKAGRYFSGQAQLTLSRFSTNTGGIGMYPQNQYRPNDEWGRAGEDRLARFNLIGNILPDHWYSLGVAATLLSGTPYNETTGSDDYHTGLGNARPAGVPHNALDASGVASLDLVWNHDFQLTRATGDKAKVFTTGVSAFNVLNRTNYTSYVGSLSSPLFGQATAALPGRQLQFSAAFRF